jgi:hypothetical protein
MQVVILLTALAHR